MHSSLRPSERVARHADWPSRESRPISCRCDSNVTVLAETPANARDRVSMRPLGSVHVREAGREVLHFPTKATDTKLNSMSRTVSHLYFDQTVYRAGLRER